MFVLVLMAKKKFYHQQVYWNVHGLHDCEFTKSLFQKMYSVLPLMSWRVWGIACTLNCQIPRRRLTHWGMTCSTGKMRLWLSSRNIWSSRASIHIIIGASEASPFLVFNIAILSVCLSVCMYVCMDWCRSIVGPPSIWTPGPIHLGYRLTTPVQYT